MPKQYISIGKTDFLPEFNYRDLAVIEHFAFFRAFVILTNRNTCTLMI